MNIANDLRFLKWCIPHNVALAGLPSFLNTLEYSRFNHLMIDLLVLDIYGPLEDSDNRYKPQQIVLYRHIPVASINHGC